MSSSTGSVSRGSPSSHNTSEEHGASSPQQNPEAIPSALNAISQSQAASPPSHSAPVVQQSSPLDDDSDLVSPKNNAQQLASPISQDFNKYNEIQKKADNQGARGFRITPTNFWGKHKVKILVGTAVAATILSVALAIIFWPASFGILGTYLTAHLFSAAVLPLAGKISIVAFFALMGLAAAMRARSNVMVFSANSLPLHYALSLFPEGLIKQIEESNYFRFVKTATAAQNGPPQEWWETEGISWDDVRKLKQNCKDTSYNDAVSDTIMNDDNMCTRYFLATKIGEFILHMSEEFNNQNHLTDQQKEEVFASVIKQGGLMTVDNVKKIFPQVIKNLNK